MQNALLERTYKDIQADRKLPQEIRKASQFDAFILVAKARSTKHATSVLNSLSKLLTANLISQAQVKDVLDAISALSKTTSDVQLKVLQLLPLVFANASTSPRGADLSTALYITIGLLDVPGIVGSIAGATLQQTLVSLFDSPQRSLEEDVGHIFEDLCSSFSGNQSDLVSFDAVKKSLLLELLESILVPQNTLFEKNAALLDVNLMPGLLNTIKDEKSSYLLVVRALRICSGLIATKGNLLHSLLQILPSASLSRQLLILEVLSTSIEQISQEMLPNIMQTLLLFEDSIPGLGTYSLCVVPKLVDEEVTIDGMVFTDSSQRHITHGIGSWLQPTKILLNQLNATGAPRTQPGYKFLLIFQILSAVADKPLTVWKDLLTMQSAFMSSSISLECESKLLEDFTRVVIALDDLKDDYPRDTYLRRLGRIAISSSVGRNVPVGRLELSMSPGEPSHRSFSCLQTYLLTATSLRNSFTYRSWKQVLDILHSADLLLSQKSQRSSQNQASLMTTVLSGADRPAILTSHSAAEISRSLLQVQAFFTTSDSIEDDSFSALIQALCDLPQGPPGSPTAITPGNSQVSSPVINRRMDSVSSMASFSASSFGPSQHTMSFSLQKLRELLPPNIKRFVENDASCGWKSLHEYLSQEIIEGNLMAAELLGIAITQATQCPLNHEWQQRRFLDALDSFSGGDAAIRVVQLETLAGVLETLGHDLISGWDLVLRILHSAVQEGPSSSSDAIRIGFSSLQLICTDLLTFMPANQMSMLVGTVVGYSLQKILFNVSLSAVGQFWTILEALSAVDDFSIVYTEIRSSMLIDMQDKSDECLWLLYIDCLVQTSQDDRPEIRNSAIQACFRTIQKLEDIGSKALLTATYLILPALCTTSISLRSDSDGLVETSNAITSGLGRALVDITERLQGSNELLRIWKATLSYVKTLIVHRPVAIGGPTLKVLLETLSAMTSSRSMTREIWSDVWQTVIDIGSSSLKGAPESQVLTEEALATYLDLLELLCLVDGTGIADERLDVVMDLAFRSLAYTRSSTYTLDVDYLSIVQKSGLKIINRLLQTLGERKSQLFFHTAKLLELASKADTRKDTYTSIKSNSPTWTGRPTFVAMTEALLAIVAQQYEVENDIHLLAMARLIEALNLMIESRFSRVSVAKAATYHELWILSAKQVLKFVESIVERLKDPGTAVVWPRFVATLRSLLRTRPGQPEEFVLAMLNSFRGLLIAHLVFQSQELVGEYLEDLYNGSCFYADAESVEASTRLAKYYDDQIIREWCLLELFKASILHPASPGELENQIDEDSAKRTSDSANTALQFAIRRSQNILSRYINNANLRAHAPLPRIEYAELLLLLEHLGDTTIVHQNQRTLLKSVYTRVVESLLVSQNDIKLLRLLQDVLFRVGLLL